MDLQNSNCSFLINSLDNSIMSKEKKKPLKCNSGFQISLFLKFFPAQCIFSFQLLPPSWQFQLVQGISTETKKEN